MVADIMVIEQAGRAIKDWVESDRPREKLLEKRPNSLTDSELLAILIRSGSSGSSAVELARKILRMCQNNLHELGILTAADLMRIKGVGKAKAAAIIAAFELGRRRQSEEVLERHYIKNSREGADYVRPLLADYRHEVFGVLYLVQAGWIRSFEIMSEGGITSTTVDQRIIFKRALETNSVSIIAFHNHPSGSLKPSAADKALTTKLHMASKTMDIKLLDHIIVGEKGYYSFADDGQLA
jgi:DNA repair protein RadC